MTLKGDVGRDPSERPARRVENVDEDNDDDHQDDDD
jgi:hypothetical protein